MSISSVGFAGLWVSVLTSSASAVFILSGVLFFWCLFRHYWPHGGASVVAETCLLGFFSTFVWSAIRLMKLVLDSDGPSAFDSSSGVSV
ncbi:hypothetical protein QL285_052483 [Trifolium repens]|nr:hypothetical protein QL285_052483 [Trifolium repens]